MKTIFKFLTIYIYKHFYNNFLKFYLKESNSTSIEINKDTVKLEIDESCNITTSQKENTPEIQQNQFNEEHKIKMESLGIYLTNDDSGNDSDKAELFNTDNNDDVESIEDVSF